MQKLILAFTLSVLSLPAGAYASDLYEMEDEALSIDVTGNEPIRLDSQKVIRVREVKKVLGRGLSDRKTGDSIQLACIGERTQENSLERECDVLRFIFRNVAGEEYLIGPSFYLHDGNSIKFQMKSYFELWNIQKDVSRKKKFMVSRMLWPGLFGEKNGPDPDDNTRQMLKIGLLTAQAYSTKVALAAATTTASAVGLFLAAGLLSPFVFDVATLPITALIDGSNGSLWGFSGRDLAALNSKAVVAWSIRPKKTRSKRFQALFRGLMKVSVRAQACTECGDRYRMRFNEKRSGDIRAYSNNLEVGNYQIEQQLKDNPYSLLSTALEEGLELSELE